MVRNPIVLTYAGKQDTEVETSISWKIRGLSADDFLLSHSVYQAERPFYVEEHRGDHAVVACLLRLMSEGRDVVVEGKVSPRLLDGIESLQQIWMRWRPDRYASVSILAEEEIEPVQQADSLDAIFAFSGGVDAAFSLYRHKQAAAGRNNLTPMAALMVHGMDIPVDQVETFEAARTRALNLIEDSKVPLTYCRTNSRQLNQGWEDSYGLQLASCLLIHQPSYRFAVKGSGEPYESLPSPWGSTPMTDSLVTTEAMQMVHDGCDYDRTEKVQWLAENTGICDTLRVCWSGENLDRNCGRCEKCVRTMLNFWATAQDIPKAFPVDLDPTLVKTVHLKHEVQVMEMKNMYAHAQKYHSERSDMMRAVKSILRRAAFARNRRQLSYLGARLIKRGK